MSASGEITCPSATRAGAAHLVDEVVSIERVPELVVVRREGGNLTREIASMVRFVPLVAD